MKNLKVIVNWFLGDPVLWAPILASILEGFAKKIRENPAEMVAIWKGLTGSDPQ